MSLALHLPASEKQRFISDIRDLWNGARQGHMIEWEYSDPLQSTDRARGSEYWDQAAHYGGYYLYQEEAELIQRAAHKVAQAVGSIASLVELGPGKSEKLLPLANVIDAEEIIGIDLSEDFLQYFGQAMSDAGKPIRLIENNFFEDISVLHNSALVCCLGSTLLNLPMTDEGRFDQGAFIGLLNMWKRRMPKGTHLLLGFDTNQNTRTLNAAYDQPYIRAMTESVWHRAMRDLPIENFNPYGISYRGEWDARHMVYKHMGVCTIDQTVYLNGERFDLKKGHSFCQSNSFKLPTSYLERLFIKAGFKPPEWYESDQMALALITV